MRCGGRESGVLDMYSVLYIFGGNMYTPRYMFVFNW